MAVAASERPRIVIIGGGFGGLSAARALRSADVEIEIIDRRNYHLFQPLLYQVATADLSPADIAWPIRGIFSKQKNVRVTMSEVSGIDLADKVVETEFRKVPYDHLIVATGATHSYFGKDHWEQHAPGLKRIVDATEIRKRVLLAFERAELAETEADRRRELTFVIVGGGPTGVEMAGAIAELAHTTLGKDFRRIIPEDTRVLLIEAGPWILGTFPPDLSETARKALEKLGVTVMVGTMVQDITADAVKTEDDVIDAATVIWGAGVQVNHMAEWLGVDTDRQGRAKVEPDLSIPGHPEVFVIGDAAHAPWRDGAAVPGIAPAAKQAGTYVGKLLAARLRGKAAPGPFRYRHLGNLATIGRNAAVIDFGRLKMSGALAWWLWGIAHIYFLIGVRQPLMVAMTWFWSYLTFSKGARLITGARQRVIPGGSGGAPRAEETQTVHLRKDAA